MMKAHCDRCDELIDNYPSWFEEREKDKEYIWHIYINNHKGQGFCKNCTIQILSNYLKILE